MERQVFKESLFSVILFNVIVFIAIGVVYYVTRNALSFLFIILSVISLVRAFRNKLIIENGNLRLVSIWRTREVALEDVSQMIVEERESTDSEGEVTVKYYMDVLDKSGHSVLQFPTQYINAKANNQRFTETIYAINPEIEISFETNFGRMKQAVVEYRQQKKEQ